MNKQITLYSMMGCAQCVSAASWLTANNIPHKVVKLEDDKDAWEFIKSEGHRSMPQLYIDSECIPGGFKGLTDLGVYKLLAKLA